MHLEFLKCIHNALSRCVLQWRHRQVVTLRKHVTEEVCNKQRKEAQNSRETSFSEVRCTARPNITVEILSAVNITLTSASCRTNAVNARPGWKGALCLCRNWKQSGCIQPTNFCLFPWLREDNIHPLYQLIFGRREYLNSIPPLFPSKEEELGRKIQTLQGAPSPFTQNYTKRWGLAFRVHLSQMWLCFMKRQCVYWNLQPRIRR